VGVSPSGEPWQLHDSPPTSILPPSTRGGGSKKPPGNSRTLPTLPPIALLLLSLMVGCAGEPFVRGPLPVLNNPDPQAMRENFARTVPQRFISDDTVIIHSPFHDLAVLGVVRVDRSAGTFDLVALNQLGVQLFAVGGDRNNSFVHFAIPPLDPHRDLLMSIADDVRRMYFDLLPSPAAKVDPRRTFVRFSERNHDGILIFEMGDNPSILLEKRQAGFFGTLWRVRYFDYSPAAGGLYPRGIVMDNSRFFYRIVVKNRDWQKQ
jgi:hypothetical protein